MATKLAPLQRVASRPATNPPAWELVVRYGAAYACVLVAVAAAQLIIPTGFAMMLAGITLMGLPVSLGVRQHGFQIGKRHYSNIAYARLVTIVTSLVVFVFLRLAMPELFGGAHGLFMRIDTLRSLAMLMQIFLLFAVCRSFAIITDKDAVLSTVPSFSVLLLLVVANHDEPIVYYFLLWSLLTAVLFAIDHRADTRLTSSAAVPPPVPGQDIAMSSRALLTVVTFSFIGAIAISNYIAAHQSSTRTGAENWIMAFTQRLANSSVGFADSSVNGGPERTIDFTSGPSLPTRAPLWRISANTLGGNERYILPAYWRMFTLESYDGHSWTQSPGNGRVVNAGKLQQPDWPILIGNWGINKRRILRPLRADQLARRAENSPAYALSRGYEAEVKSYGTPRLLVRQTVGAIITTSGYMPVLPALKAVKMSSVRANGLRVRKDGSVDMGVMQRDERAEVLSEVPDIPEYGGAKSPPLHKGERPNPGARLSAAERAENLRVPALVPARVRDWAAKVLRNAGGDENAFRRAQRLAIAVRNSGTYTLRPPTMPEDREATDYFLFETHRGYCTHFADALTIACRTQGIPARMVSGFVNTEWMKDPNDRVWTIALESNSHAWTEVWVDGWGWAVLDATPSDDRGDNAPGFWDGLGDGFATNWHSLIVWVEAWRVPLLWSAAAFVTMLLCARRGALAWLAALRRDWRLRREARGAFRENDLARARIIEAYRQGEKLLAARYRRRAPWETPREWIDGAQANLSLADTAPLETLATLYMRARYSLRALEEIDGETAHSALLSLSWRKMN